MAAVRDEMERYRSDCMLTECERLQYVSGAVAQRTHRPLRPTYQVRGEVTAMRVLVWGPRCGALLRAGRRGESERSGQCNRDAQDGPAIEQAHGPAAALTWSAFR